MSQKVWLEILFISIFVCVFFKHAKAIVACSPTVFQCMSGKCIPKGWFCDGANDCGDNSDEAYCVRSRSYPCPPGWFRCPQGDRCIPSYWKCDGAADCKGISEETNCNSDGIKVAGVHETQRNLKAWFLQQRKLNGYADKWGYQIQRIAVALHLADESTFSPGNITGDEIRYELTIQLLHRLSKEKKMNSQELALYIHAILVTCMNPKDFYGINLVQKLRNRVEASGNYTNPFQILVLCNAGDTMTSRDVERVTYAYDAQQRPFWTDLQALASLALACISSSSEGIGEESTLNDLLQELKKHQFRNGTVDNFRTTALVSQAMFINDSYKKEFDMNASIQVIIDGLKANYTLLDAYYALPVLHSKSMLNVTSAHCRTVSDTEDEALQKVLNANDNTISVKYSVWIGDKVNVARSWNLKMKANCTIYDVLEMVERIDNRQKVKYNTVEGKPYVSAVNAMEDDPEMGSYWFIYLKSFNSGEQPKIVEESPVDLKLLPNQEIILWYKPGPWNSPTITQSTESST